MLTACLCKKQKKLFERPGGTLTLYFIEFKISKKMPGAIAGTAILNTAGQTDQLHTITLTINNSCNLNCPHCYLQYGSKDKYIEPKTIEAIFSSEFKHLAIVGKEPLVNRHSLALLRQLTLRAKAGGRTVSLITNGTALRKLEPELIPLFDYVDISFDGGPATYESYRKQSFEHIIDGVQYLKTHNVQQVNALHTISDRTLSALDDMLAVQFYEHFEHIMFSPYLATQNSGSNFVMPISLQSILKAFNASLLFGNTRQAFLLIDLQHLKNDGHTSEQVLKQIHSFNFGLHKIKLITQDPLHFGIIRVTFDDLVLSPYESTDTLYYQDTAKYRASSGNLNEVFADMLSQSVC